MIPLNEIDIVAGDYYDDGHGKYVRCTLQTDATEAELHNMIANLPTEYHQIIECLNDYEPQGPTVELVDWLYENGFTAHDAYEKTGADLAATRDDWIEFRDSQIEWRKNPYEHVSIGGAELFLILVWFLQRQYPERYFEIVAKRPVVSIGAYGIEH